MPRGLFLQKKKKDIIYPLPSSTAQYSDIKFSVQALVLCLILGILK